MSLPQTLPLARYRYTFRMRDALRLPDYAGSLLRGQFGATLRRISCMTQQPNCDGCPLRTSCPYAAVFEAPAPAQHDMQQFSHIPNPYVVEPPPIGSPTVHPGEPFAFNLVVFGQALTHVPLISFALQRAFEQGLGAERARGVLERIEVQQAGNGGLARESAWLPIWHAGDAQLAAHVTALPMDFPEKGQTVNRAQLTFLTPLRLQQQGQPVRPGALTPRKLIADLLRRVTLLADFHAGLRDAVPDAPQLVLHAEGIAHQCDLYWHDWTRYSSRQQRKMTLGGALGTWTFEGDLAPLIPWLRLGQWLHVGKNASLGMGRYQLDIG